MTAAANLPNEGGIPKRRTVLDIIFSSGPYQASLKSRVPKRLSLVPVDVFPGDSDRADNIFQGHFDFAGHEFFLASPEPWHAEGQPLAWHRELHEFGWLRDFSANGSEAAKRHSRALILSWISHFETYVPYVWDEDVLSQRIINWFCYSGFLMEREDSDFNFRFLRSLRRQYLHLSRISKRKPLLQDRFCLWQALLYGTLCFPDLQKQTDKIMASLETEVGRVVMTDGCHISRNPEHHLMLLGRLVGLRNTLMAANVIVPIILNNTIDRLAPAVRFFQHGDGRLALFNGGSQMDEGYCDMLLSQSDATGRAPHRFPQGGFERLKAGRALLIIETGEGGRTKHDLRHSGLLGFEFSYARERLIVNCGGSRDLDSSWGRALASTAAHSTLGFDNLNADFPTSQEVEQSAVVRNEEEGNVWLDLESSGYLSSVGLRHRRRLFIDASGLALRGEDQLIPERQPSTRRSRFTLRFHLHPDLSISRSAGGKNILIRTPSGSGWKFLTGAPLLTLEESVYCSVPGERRHNQQIVIAGQLENENPVLVKWALTRLSE
ncbi:heparinase II/III family protein [Sneathiella marina]|uniref:Heparinase II/III family protein n=1 Tax=Sneathiella marina TaxID=2950108 RepID=A0ABY4W2A5_9PROT|nr:heparinase II/III family protein [Sneathiella marina]USG61288.1 heparinase II/III family protein [Sneathiella marina]